MFSFAIWDNDDKILFLARDRLGIKPLYYFISENGLIISSEIKAAYENNKYQKKNTDDASVFESYKGKIVQLIGEERNIKITHEEDLKIAEALI